MKSVDLFRMLEFPEEVVEALLEYEKARKADITNTIKEKLLIRSCWEEAIQELKEYLGEDVNGFKILWELLNIVGEYTYEEYRKKDISDEIFVDTMKFCTRYLNEHQKNFVSYRFTMAWWFVRELAFLEFRVGALEYEFVDGEQREIHIHIPSDADFCEESVEASLNAFYKFRKQYFPEWEEVQLVCDSWLLAPALKELLDENSNILAFQERFELDIINLEATWFMTFIYPGHETVDEGLPEKTALQRRMKAYLLEGKKVGVAKGHLKN